MPTTIEQAGVKSLSDLFGGSGGGALPLLASGGLAATLAKTPANSKVPSFWSQPPAALLEQAQAPAKLAQAPAFRMSLRPS